MRTRFIGGPWDGKEVDETTTKACSVQMFFGHRTMHIYERGATGDLFYCTSPLVREAAGEREAGSVSRARRRRGR